ncbi:MAG: exonuclease SbcCD subunit D [Anaeromyxobacter sp.]
MTLRVLHTSDWHLGRTLHAESLLDDQAWALDRLLEVAKDERPDVLVVAGDIYDRAVPPAEAVQLLDEVLTRLADLGLPAVITAGNHDSAERLSFASRLLAAKGLHLRGDLRRAAEPIEVPGKGCVYALPFVEPELVRALTGDEDVRGHAVATERILAAARADAATRTLPTVLVGHAFVQGASQTPDSERPIIVGTAGSVGAEVFAGFDYIALGHLHAPQEVAPGLAYSGSLLQYSFAEATHEKRVVMVEVDRGAVRSRAIPLGAKRRVARIEGTLAELLEKPEFAPHKHDLLEVTLTDEGYVLDAKNRLQERFRHVLNVVRKELALGAVASKFGAQVDGAGNDDAKLFGSFFETVTGTVAGPAHREVFAEALSELDLKERVA